MIVQDYESVLTSVDRVVAELDVQPPQVLIEAVILNLSLTKGQELGINFAVLNSAGTLLSVVGNGALLNSAVGFLPAGTGHGQHFAGVRVQSICLRNRRRHRWRLRRVRNLALPTTRTA